MQTVQENAKAVDAARRDDAKLKSHYLLYASLVIFPIIIFLVILFVGEKLPSSVGVAAPSENGNPTVPITFNLALMLSQSAVVIAVARVFGILFARFGQPRVIGEMIAGLALGPSFLKWAWPGAYDWIFPGGVARLNSLSQIGIVLFIFLVGFELDLKNVRNNFRQILVVSHAGMALPMLGSGLLAFLLFHNYAPAGNSFSVFALFFACAMSVTAFPVLVRILAERNLSNTSLGVTAIACASVADVTAWAMLALAVALERGNRNVSTVLWHTIIGATIFLLLMFFAVRPMLAYYWKTRTALRFMPSHNELSVIVLIVLLSALITEKINLHGIFGAFIAGVIMPRDEKLQAAVRMRFEDVLVVLLLPLFFAFTGLRTDIGLLATERDWCFAGLIFFVAVTGKLCGSAVAARATGFAWRDAGALGVLMNSRGLIELVLLTIGLQDGIITPALFTMMVFMAVGTTIMTTPIFSQLVRAPLKENKLS